MADEVDKDNTQGRTEIVVKNDNEEQKNSNNDGKNSELVKTKSILGEHQIEELKNAFSLFDKGK